MSFRVRLCALVLAVMAAPGLLSGCGGGGGGASGSDQTPAPSPVPTSYAPLTQDEVPAGARVALDMSQPYPLDQQTYWTYAQVDGTGRVLNDVERFVLDKDANGFTRIREVNGQEVDDELVRWTTEGLRFTDPWDVQALMPGLAVALAQWVDLPTPMFPVSSVRRAIRQGDLGSDLDGDGKFETFRVELSQTNLGFEQIQVLGQMRRVLHLRSQIQLSIAATKGTPITFNGTEDSFYADGLGPLRFERKVNWSAIGTTPASSQSKVLTLKRLQRQDMLWTDAGLSFSVNFKAQGLAYDAKRQVFLASVDWAADPSVAQTLATIDPRTGRTSYSTPLPDAPSLLAVAADGDSVYVLMERSNEVRRLALPGLTEISRAPVPAGPEGQALAVLSLSASPTVADLVAVTTRPQAFANPANPVTVRLIRNGTWLNDTLSVSGRGNSSASFSLDGTELFVLNEETLYQSNLVRATVSGTGLNETLRRTVEGSGRLSSLAGRLIVGRHVYSTTGGLTLVGKVAEANDNTSCVPLPATGKIACQGLTDFGVLVADAQSLAKLGLFSYSPTSMSLGVSFVPGPPGVLAVAEQQRLAVFASDVLK